MHTLKHNTKLSSSHCSQHLSEGKKIRHALNHRASESDCIPSFIQEKINPAKLYLKAPIDFNVNITSINQ